jgi:hypothetical protein
MLCIRMRNLAFLPLRGFRTFLAERGSSSLGQMRNGAFLFRGFRRLFDVLASCSSLFR